MSSQRRGFSFDHPIVITALVFAIIGFLSFASEVLKPLALALLLSFALAPLAGFLERRGLPRFPSVLLTVLLALIALGAIGYKVGDELNTLAMSIDKDRLEANVRNKLGPLHSRRGTAIEKLSVLGRDLSRLVDRPGRVAGATPVQVVSEPSTSERLGRLVGPYLEGLGMAVFVLVLVLFILANRDDLNDRLIRVFGKRRVSLTTKTLDEVGRRISRYLVMFALVNSAMGVTIGLGLGAIGVPLATLWGVLTALFRFIPYVGPIAALSMPLLYTIAIFPGWQQPLLVIGLFAVVETLLNSFVEPLVYGKTTGVNALGLLVAALFWTWLWGILGLLLSTPLTVCLAVMGKSVPGLDFFANLLGEEEPLEPDVRFYHRLLAMDQDGAEQIVEAELKQRPRAEVFDTILVPTLSRAERDRSHGDLDDRELAYIQRFAGDLIGELESVPEVDLESLAAAAKATTDGQDAGIGGDKSGADACILGVIANNQSEAIVLRMLDLLLLPHGPRLTILDELVAPLKLTEHVEQLEPSMIVLSHLPPGGSASTRYLVRRLRARFAGVSIHVGRWGEPGDPSAVAEPLTRAGATCVDFHLAEARDRILDELRPRGDSEPVQATREPASPPPVGSAPIG